MDVFQIARRRINPSDLADDETFWRRLWLDVAGRLPPVEETFDSWTRRTPQKRNEAIEAVLERSEYADFFLGA